MRYSKEQLDFLLTEYRRLSLAELTRAFNAKFGTTCKITSIRGATRNHKMKSGRTGRFEQGRNPWNQGIKGYPNRSSTKFKKGSRPHNYKPVGSTRRSKDGYIEIKTADPKTWTPKHKIIWEAEHGPVPAGMMIKYRDGNRDNCTLGNLELVSRAENAVLNKFKYSNYPDEIKPSVRLVAQLSMKRREVDQRENIRSRN